MDAFCVSPSTDRAIRAEMWSTRSLSRSGRSGEAKKAVTTSSRVSFASLGGDSCRVEFGCTEPVVIFAGMVPLPEAFVSSNSPFPSTSRLARERFCFSEADGDGPKARRLGRVMGVKSTYILFMCVWYSENSSSLILGWTGLAMSSLAWNSRTGYSEYAVTADVLAAAVPP